MTMLFIVRKHPSLIQLISAECIYKKCVCLPDTIELITAGQIAHLGLSGRHEKCWYTHGQSVLHCLFRLCNGNKATIEGPMAPQDDVCIPIGLYSEHISQQDSSLQHYIITANPLSLLNRTTRWDEELISRLCIQLSQLENFIQPWYPYKKWWGHRLFSCSERNYSYAT